MAYPSTLLANEILRYCGLERKFNIITLKLLVFIINEQYYYATKELLIDDIYYSYEKNSFYFAKNKNHWHSMEDYCYLKTCDSFTVPQFISSRIKDEDKLKLIELLIETYSVLSFNELIEFSCRYFGVLSVFVAYTKKFGVTSEYRLINEPYYRYSLYLQTDKEEQENFKNFSLEMHEKYKLELEEKKQNSLFNKIKRKLLRRG